VHAVGASADSGAAVSVGDVSVVEGDAGYAVVQVPVDLSVPVATTVKVPYSIVPDGGSADGGDVVLKSGKVTFSALQTTKAISVKVAGDTIPEQDQRFSVKLGTPIGAARVGNATGDLVVQDDDQSGAAASSSSDLEASVGSLQVEEADSGLHKAYLPITLNRPATSKVILTFQVDCSVASMISDVSLRTSGRITFLAGERSKSIPLTINADTTPENIETLGEKIAASFGPLKVWQATGDITVVDNDGGNFGRGLPNFSPSPLPAPTGFNSGTVGAAEPVSVAEDGSPAQYPTVPPNENSPKLSSRPAISADGRYVAFESDATNLVPNDTNGMGDIFVHDRQSGANELASVHTDGTPVSTGEMSNLAPFGVSNWAPALSADGRYVAFTTPAPLSPDDTSGGSWINLQDVYVFDRVTHAVDLVSAMPDGTAAGGVMFSPSISADGRYVAFSALANSTRLPLGTLGAGMYDHRMYVRDRLMGTTTLIFDGEGWQPTISADGTTVVFGTSVGVCPAGPQLVAVNLATGAQDRVDVTSDNAPGFETDFSEQYFNPSVSADGRYVSFTSWAWNLIPGMTSGAAAGSSGAIPIMLVHAFVRDRVAGTTKMLPPVIEYDDQTSVSNDGTMVAAGSGILGLGLIDVASGVSTGYGSGGKTNDKHPISGDGRYIAFTRDNWPYGDVYVARIG